MQEHNLPVDDSVAEKIGNDAGGLSEIARMDEGMCRQHLREQWAKLEHPCNREISDFLLSATALFVSECENRFWLTFLITPDTRLSIERMRPEEWPKDLQFPISCRPEVREFILSFGGLTNRPWLGDRFCRTSDLLVVRQNDPDFQWGDVKGWQGALAIFQGGTGNLIVMRADGKTGKWDHDLSDPREGQRAIRDLRRKFPQLLQDYLAYCQLPSDSSERAESPFYE